MGTLLWQTTAGWEMGILRKHPPTASELRQAATNRMEWQSHIADRPSGPRETAIVSSGQQSSLSLSRHKFPNEVQNLLKARHVLAHTSEIVHLLCRMIFLSKLIVQNVTMNELRGESRREQRCPEKRRDS